MHVCACSLNKGSVDLGLRDVLSFCELLGNGSDVFEDGVRFLHTEEVGNFSYVEDVVDVLHKGLVDDLGREMGRQVRERERGG